jgi:hypothetical protein
VNSFEAGTLGIVKLEIVHWKGWGDL